MTVVDDAVMGVAPSASPGGSRFGDGFVWYPADDRRNFDPVTDVAIGDSTEVGPEWIAAAVEHCAQGLSMLESLDPTSFDAATVAAWATGVEQLRRQGHAAAIAVADHLDAARPFRDLGFFTAKSWMKHHLQLSGSEAHGRVQEARLRRAVTVWNNALAAGQLGVAQTRLMARIAANPRIEPDVLTRGVWQLMVDAMDCSYVEFERRALTWEALADPLGAAEKLERNRQRRTASVHQNADGSWNLNAVFDDVGGPEFLEIFCWFVDREFDRDWKEATRRLGEGNVDVSKLQPHRSATPLGRALGNGEGRRGVPARSCTTAADRQLPPRRHHRCCHRRRSRRSTRSTTAVSRRAPTAVIASTPTPSSACRCGRSSAGWSPKPMAWSSSWGARDDSSAGSHARRSCCSSPRASGRAVTNPTRGATPTISPAGPPVDRPTPTTAHRCVLVTTT